jgi:hypothetical protein
MWTVFIRFRIQFCDGLQRTFVFHKRREISWPAEWLLPPQEGPCSAELFHLNITCYLHITPHHMPSSMTLKMTRLPIFSCMLHVQQIPNYHRLMRNRDSSVGIALSYGLDDQDSRVRFPAGAVNSSLHHCGVLSLGVKRPGREADHSSHLVPRSKNKWSYTSPPQYAFMEWCLVKHRDFTFTFTIDLCSSLKTARSS